MKIFFLKVLMWIQIGVSRLTDDIFNLFTVFAGIEEVRAEGSDMSLLMYFISNKTVQGVFWAILVLGIFCAGIFTSIAVMKNMVTVKKTVGKVVGQLLTSIVSMVLVVVALFGFIFGANVVLSEVQNGFQLEQKEDLTVGQQLLQSAVGDAWENKSIETGTEGVVENVPCDIRDLFGVDENGKINKSWKGITPDKIFGVYGKEWGLFEAEKNGFKKGCEPMVNIDEYNFFIGVPAVIILGVIIFIAALGLVVRLYDLVFIFLCSPLLMATYPLDDGAKFKLWRETAISKTLLAYGSVFAINIYLIILPLINRITIPLHASLTTLAQVLLIICGALTISNGQIFFSRLIGTSAEESRQAAHGMRAMFAGAMGTFGAVRTAGRMTFGTYNAYTGHRERGLLQRGKRAIGGMTNAGATIFTGGNGGARDSNGRRIRTTDVWQQHRTEKMDNLRTRWKDNGGTIGYGKKAKRRIEDIRDTTHPHTEPRSSKQYHKNLEKEIKKQNKKRGEK